jgi:PPM family protein phosphatase
VTGSIRLRIAGLTHPGRVRSENQDRFAAADLAARGAVLDGGEEEVRPGPQGVLLVVADGMGGEAAGGLASEIAVDRILDAMVADDGAEAGEPPRGDSHHFAGRLRQAVEEANLAIHYHAEANPAFRGMGTTVTAAGIVGGELFLAQVGDSRAYLVREGETVQLTRDQSLLQHLLDAGQISEEEAARSKRRNVILQALGPSPHVVVDLTVQQLRRGDALLLCSDGLSGVVRREEIGRFVAEDRDLREVCRDLVALANHRGGPDNVTVVVARFDGPGLAEPDHGDRVGHQSYPLDP